MLFRSVSQSRYEHAQLPNTQLHTNDENEQTILLLSLQLPTTKYHKHHTHYQRNLPGPHHTEPAKPLPQPQNQYQEESLEHPERRVRRNLRRGTNPTAIEEQPATRQPGTNSARQSPVDNTNEQKPITNNSHHTLNN